jgi:hypothetical protein
MKKDAFYFPHFSNARNDSKIIKLRRVLGIEGYGLYFMLLEVLREQTDFQFPVSGVEDLSYEWHISKEKIYSVIKDFDLFVINEYNFFSENLIMYLQPYIEKSQRAIEAANIRWANAKAYANALPVQSKSNASKVKESKGNENKEYILNEFDIFRKVFPGKKRGLETEFNNFKKHKDWEECLILLLPSIKNQIVEYENKIALGKWVPEWKILQTWINKRCWEENIELSNHKQPLSR